MVKARQRGPRRRATAGGAGLDLDGDWFWLQLASCLPLLLRLRLRTASSTAALAVLAAEESSESEVDREVFQGLLPEIKQVLAMSDLEDAMAEVAAKRRTAVKSVLDTSLSPWICLTRAIHRKWRPTRDGYMLKSRDSKLQFASGTLLLLEGRIRISNCFNPLVQNGPKVTGAWWYRSQDGNDVLEKLGKANMSFSLDEYHNFHGRCSLPTVVAEWRYVVDVLPPSEDAAYVAALLCESSDDMIEHVSIPPNLATVARAAVSHSQEALLLRWVVADEEPVCVRLAVYGSAGPELVVDEVPFSSHQRWAEPPAAAT